MAQAVDPLPEDFIFPLQEKIGFVELPLLSPQAPEVEQPPLAESREERKAQEQSAEDVKQPGS